MKKEERIVKCWVDGSCYAKHPEKLGGVGVYLTYNGYTKKVSKGFSNTKIGRMELRALITAFQTVTGKSVKLEIHSDSQYVVNSFRKGWIFQWEKDDFLGRKNTDLLLLLLKEYRMFPEGNISINWIPGHSGDEGNEIADRLADYKFQKSYEKDLKGSVI